MHLSKIINGLLKLLRHLHLQDNGTVENGNFMPEVCVCFITLKSAKLPIV